jgi:hypothetical protein
MLVMLPLIVFSQLSCDKADASITSSFYTPLELDDWETMDPLKSQITIRQILKMRSGYPWEEFSDYMPGQDGEEAWEKQKSITDMVGKYISKLP